MLHVTSHEWERPVPQAKRRRGRLLRRVVLATGLSLVVLAAGIVVAGYLTVSHYAGSIHRICGIMALDATRQPVMPVGSRRSMTVLLTLSGVLPGGSGVQNGLIALIHLDAYGRTGAVITIPADALVRVARSWHDAVVECPAIRRTFASHRDRGRADQCQDRSLLGAEFPRRAAPDRRDGRRQRGCAVCVYQ